MDQSVRAQLWRLDNSAHTVVDLAAFPIPPQADAVDEKNGSGAAQDQGDSGEVQTLQENRSSQGGDEPGDHGSLQGAQREPPGWLSPFGLTDAAPVCFLSITRLLHRVETGSLHWMDLGSLNQGSLLRASYRHGNHHAGFTEDNPNGAGCRSRASKDDDDDARGLHFDVLERVQRLEPLFSVQ